MAKAQRDLKKGIRPHLENEKLKDLMGDMTTCTNFDPEYYIDENGKKKMRKVPRSMGFIWLHLCEMLPGVFKRLGGSPFCIVNNEIFSLDTPSKFFAMVMKLDIKVNWADHGDGIIKRGEFFSFVGQHADKYDLISDLPSYPEMEGVYYTKKIPPRETGRLEELVNQFSYATDVGRQLIKAMFMTPFWGGECGKRPAFVIDGLEDDAKGNRGIGKTTITDALVELCGGSCIDLTTKTDGDDIKKRILTATSERIVRIDNIKVQSLSNETLESLITSKRVSGHKLFIGQHSVPNAFTYVLTFNGVKLSKDMSQRSMIIRLRRPEYKSDWWEKLVDFIKKYREEIIADIGFLFTKEPQVFRAVSRFPQWEKEVLSRVAFSLKTIQDDIGSEQINSDDENALREEIREIVMDHIAWTHWHDGKNFDPEINTVGIDRALVFDWLAELFPKGMSRRWIGTKFKDAMPKEFLPEVKRYLGNRYLIWVGANSQEFKAEAPGFDAPSFYPRGCWKIDRDGECREKAWDFLLGACK